MPVNHLINALALGTRMAVKGTRHSLKTKSTRKNTGNRTQSIVTENTVNDYKSMEEAQNAARARSRERFSSKAKECVLCKTQFSLFNRRHHCRVCNQPMCNACSSIKWSSDCVPAGIATQKSKTVRVCVTCNSANSEFLNCLKSDDPDGMQRIIDDDVNKAVNFFVRCKAQHDRTHRSPIRMFSIFSFLLFSLNIPPSLISYAI